MFNSDALAPVPLAPKQIKVVQADKFSDVQSTFSTGFVWH